jgi:hypothetical protein
MPAMIKIAVVRLALVLAAAALAPYGCAGPPDSTAPASSPSPPAAERAATLPAGSWDRFVEDFLESYFAAHPEFAVEQGRHEYDGQLPDWSAAGLRRLTEELQRAHQRAAAFAEEDLEPAERFERRYLLARIEGELFWLEEARWPHRNPLYYNGALSPSVYLTREYAPLAVRMTAYTRFARNFPGAIRQARENLETPLPRTYLETAQRFFAGLVTYLGDDVPAIFAGVPAAEVSEGFAEANAGAVRAAQEMAAWLSGQLASATDDFALGEERFLVMLRATERVDLPLSRLREVGERDLARNLAALEEACRTIAAGASLADCVAGVQEEKPTQGPVAAAREQLASLEAFVREKGLVSIPGSEKAKVAEAPPYRRWNAAYIEIPGPYEQALPSVYYIAPPDPAWSEEERRAYIPGRHELLFISVHEVWPGHFLQFLHANRAPSRLGQVFVGYAFAEGWAHYTEEMMWEAGLADGDPKVHVGQLLNALLRNVRFLSAIGLHTGGMTVPESERMFQEKGFQDPGNARQQAARGTFDPGYLNYTLGKLMILKLREDWTADRGGRTAWKEFHDRLLSYGGPPLPLVREDMVGPEAGPVL